MTIVIRIVIIGLLCLQAASHASGPRVTSAPKDTNETAAAGAAYRIEKPGTITFTVGVKIKGKVEKPQVMIFLPKEKPYYYKSTFSYSFSEEIMKPLPFQPIEK